MPALRATLARVLRRIRVSDRIRTLVPWGYNAQDRRVRQGDICETHPRRVGVVPPRRERVRRPGVSNVGRPKALALSISRPPRAQRVAAFVLLAALLGAGGRVAYRTGWRSCLGATEAATPLAITNGPSEDSIVLAFGHNSTGVVGTYVSALSIHQSGYVTFGDGLSYPWTIGHTQLAPEELARLLRTVEEAKFVELQHCYGRHASLHAQESCVMYNRR